MKVVIDGRYIQDSFPGIGRYTYNLVRSLGQLVTDDEFIVLFNSMLNNKRYDLHSLTELHRLRLIDCRIPRFLPAEFLLLSRYINRLKPDLYHSPFFLRPFPLACPCLITLHDLIPLDYPKSAGGLINNVVFRVGVKLACRSSSIITPSMASAIDINKRFNVPKKSIHTIVSAPDPNFRKQSPDTIRKMRRRYSLDKPYVLHVGSHLPHKNIAGLIRAWAGFVQISNPINTPFQLVLAGWDSKEDSEERRLVKKLQMDPYVVFLGLIDENMLPALYSGADLFVFPSFIEGYGFPVIEAMACGTPVVCSDIPSLRELSAGAARLVDPKGIDTMTQVISDILVDDTLREQLSRKGYIRSCQFNWMTIAQQTHDIYRHILNDKCKDY